MKIATRKPYSREVIFTDAGHVEACESAERESLAQLEIIRAVKPLDRDGAERVLHAVGLILEADRLIPGILARFKEAPK